MEKVRKSTNEIGEQSSTELEEKIQENNVTKVRNSGIDIDWIVVFTFMLVLNVYIIFRLFDIVYKIVKNRRTKDKCI